MLNTAELRRAMDLVIAADAEGLHDQTDWIRRYDCGTGGCFAGTYALDRGCVPVWGVRDETTDVVRAPNGAQWEVSAWAQLELGLTNEQARELFAVSNSLADLKDLVDEMCVASG